MGKLLGVDYGEARTGLAVSDPMQIIASPYKTLSIKDEFLLIKKIVQITKDKNIEKIIVGLPRGTSGEDTDRTKKTRKFIETLKQRADVQVEAVDERFSSNEAKDVLHQQDIKTGHNKEKVDKTAAAIILRRYLDEL